MMKLNLPTVKTALIGLVVLLIINLVGYYFNHYDADLWWSNWFPAYAAWTVIFLVRWRRDRSKRCCLGGCQ